MLRLSSHCPPTPLYPCLSTLCSTSALAVLTSSPEPSQKRGESTILNQQPYQLRLSSSSYQLPLPMSALRLGLLVPLIAAATQAATTSKSVAIVVEDGFYLIDAMGPLQVRL